MPHTGDCYQMGLEFKGVIGVQKLETNMYLSL